jgi:hypothetical protein
VTIDEDDIGKDVVFDRIFDVEEVSVNADVDDMTIGEDDIDKDIVFDVVTKLLVVVVVETGIAVATDVEPPIVTGSIVDADDNIAVEDCGEVLVVVILARKFN